jgi:hypothetical protein
MNVDDHESRQMNHIHLVNQFAGRQKCAEFVGELAIFYCIGELPTLSNGGTRMVV